MSDEEFWKSTPVKIGAMWDIYIESNNLEVREKEKKVFIDEIPFI